LVEVRKDGLTFRGEAFIRMEASVGEEDDICGDTGGGAMRLESASVRRDGSIPAIGGFCNDANVFKVDAAEEEEEGPPPTPAGEVDPSPSIRRR
jgi:hypothetical protein